MTVPAEAKPAFPRQSGLARLAALERRYDGPFAAGAALDPAERALRRAAEAEAACRFFALRTRRALGFVRLHRAQGRSDLAGLMLEEARAYRAAFRCWHRRALDEAAAAPDCCGAAATVRRTVWFRPQCSK